MAKIVQNIIKQQIRIFVLVNKWYAERYILQVVKRYNRKLEERLSTDLFIYIFREYRNVIV